MKICNIVKSNEKALICEKILRQLPEWFNLESGILEYTEKSKKPICEMFAMSDKDGYLGFVMTEKIKPNVIEIVAMGVLKKYQNIGIGRKLMNKLFEIYTDYLFIVKTVDKVSGDENDYAKTRAFYKKLGFIELIKLDNLWDKNNPCLIMIKERKKL